MRIFITITSLLLFFVDDSSAQISYSGVVGKAPVELVTNVYSDGDTRAIYCYSNYDEPIVINGKLNKGKLVLYEKDKLKKNSATLTFIDFSSKRDTVHGTWKNLLTAKELPITLIKKFDLDETGNEPAQREIIQSIALPDHYFKLLVTKEGIARITGIKILEKKTDQLVQQIDVDCQLSGLDNISIGDFNFDGITDFAVFETSYAGPNTSSLYFLFDPKTKKYFNSGYEGVSLEFNEKEKRIYEHNSCCLGRIVTSAVYKVVHNKMVVTEQHCFVWNEKKQELVERKLKDCQ
jgi:hypothetical protein